MPAPSDDAGAGAATPANGVNTAMQVLFGYIPTEVLTLYVAVVAAVHPTPAAGQPAPPITHTDWAMFWGFLIATPAVFWVVYASKLKGAGKPLPIGFATWPL